MLHPRAERRGAAAANCALGWGLIVGVLACASTVNAQTTCTSAVNAQAAALNSYFSAATPADGAVFYYKPGSGPFVFPPPGYVVEVHDPDLNGTANGNIQPLDYVPAAAPFAFAMEADETAMLRCYEKGPIASISRGAYVGSAEFYPGRPKSFRPKTNTGDDPHQAVKDEWFCPEWGAYSSPREPNAPDFLPTPETGCGAVDLPIVPSDVSFTNIVDDNTGNIWTNRTSFQFSFTADESVADGLEVPNFARTICIQARIGPAGGLDPDVNAAHIRCWSIIFDIAPKAAECSTEVDELTCGKKMLPLVLESQINMEAAQPIPSVLDIVRVGVGQTLNVNVYFEDMNRDDTVNCSSCDDVTINVRSDPGLPNGASLGATKGRNDVDFSPDAPSRLVRYKDAASDSTRAYYVYSRTLTFTPTLADAQNVRGDNEGNGVLYRICFDASSAKTGVASNPSSTRSQAYCGFIQVVLPLPHMEDAIQQRPPTSMPMELPFHDMNDQPLKEGTTMLPYEVTVRCPYEWVIRTQDRQNLPGDFAEVDEMTAGYEPGHYVSSVMADPASPLPRGAEISALTSSNLVEHQVLSWTPERGMEGHTFSFCLHVTDRAIRTNAFSACTKLMVKKCEVCTEAGDTLHSVAIDYRTDWLQLWGANPLVPAPNLLGQYNVIHLGPLFTTNRDEATSVLAARFSMTPEDLAAVNPDLGGSKSVVSGTDVCIVPRICEGGPQESMM